jgi:hypothetical protein
MLLGLPPNFFDVREAKSLGRSARGERVVDRRREAWF